ncbi:MAG TPA: aspartate aminotransferase family protein [Clostridiales bacterium]|nr:aspartate aminotransferase family protein [Clostridiales bacterium]
MNLDSLMELDRKVYFNTFGTRVPACFTRGEGVWLWDTEGRKYMDMLAGIAVSVLGHGHPKLVEAICTQARELIHCSNYYYIEKQTLLARQLVENTCADRVFFCNSGAEANEGAVKLARIHYYKQGRQGKYRILCLHNSFHGRTITTLAATGQEKYSKPFEPVTPGFCHVPLHDLKALDAATGDGSQFCAVMMEPVQGEGGVYPAENAYLQEVRKICDQKDMLLIFDEIQCGMGRTGKLMAFEYAGVEPDIFTLAKALGGGVPIGAFLAREPVASSLTPGEHGSTFGGNPLACAAGLAVMEELVQGGLVQWAGELGEEFLKKLKALAGRHPLIREVRGRGLMLGIEYIGPAAGEIKKRLFERGILAGTAGESVTRLLPPLILARNDMEFFLRIYEDVIQLIENVNGGTKA